MRIEDGILAAYGAIGVITWLNLKWSEAAEREGNVYILFQALFWPLVFAHAAYKWYKRKYVDIE